MSKTEKNKEFYEMADAFIALANKHNNDKSSHPGTVSATFLYAAARFNTFIVASSFESADEFASKRDEAIDYFVAEYKKMLDEHFSDYITNFDTYIGEQNKTPH